MDGRRAWTATCSSTSRWCSPWRGGGRLEEVLAEAAIEEPGFFLSFPERAAMAPKLEAVVDVARTVAGRR